MYNNFFREKKITLLVLHMSIVYYNNNFIQNQLCLKYDHLK